MPTRPSSSTASSTTASPTCPAPCRSPRAQALNNATLPFGLTLADHGARGARPRQASPQRPQRPPRPHHPSRRRRGPRPRPHRSRPRRLGHAILPGARSERARRQRRALCLFGRLPGRDEQKKKGTLREAERPDWSRAAYSPMNRRRHFQPISIERSFSSFHFHFSIAPTDQLSQKATIVPIACKFF